MKNQKMKRAAIDKTLVVLIVLVLIFSYIVIKNFIA